MSASCSAVGGAFSYMTFIDRLGGELIEASLLLSHLWLFSACNPEFLFIYYCPACIICKELG